ncbi:MAG: glycosyltransferase [Vicinamibacterales bacterium]
MRVAICTYWYPPTRTIASLRLAKFVKFLPEFGWEPHVFTITPVTNRYTAAGALQDEAPPAHVHRVPDPSVHVWVDRLAARVRGRSEASSSPSTQRSATATPEGGGSAVTRLAYRLYRDFVCMPDEAWPWLRHYREIRDAAANASVDLIFSSSPPATSHVLARRLAADLGKPWVADLRDPWADMHTLDRNAVRRWLDVRLERRTLSHAAALTTVSAPMAKRFAADYDAPVHVIMNGYDAADVPAALADVQPESDRLTLVYTGLLYEGRRTPLMVFQALRRLHERSAIDLAHVAVRLYGRNLAIAERQLRDFPELAGVVHLGGEVSYQESLVLQRRATVLLLLEWPDPRAVGVVTGKLFEYLSTGRPILAIGPHGGEIDRILGETGGGMLAQTIEELEQRLLTLYEDFRAHGPASSCAPSAILEQFTRRAMTGRLADAFNSVMRSTGAATATATADTRHAEVG